MRVSVLICTIVLLLQLLQVSKAQVCVLLCPIETSLNIPSCQCNSVTESTCPSGSTPAGNPQDQCTCETRTQPICPFGQPVNTVTCQCNLLVPILCIEGRDCVTTSDPLCPPGTTLRDCQCVGEDARKCDEGELSFDRCQCTSSSSPKCFNGCQLNTNLCTCNRVINNRLQCFSTPNCRGPGRAVSNPFECCTGRGTDSPFGVGSYRIADGPCIRCF